MKQKDVARIAVLIDGENVASKYAKAIFDEIATFGEASVRRIYGNFDGSKLDGWKKVLPELAIIPHHQYAYTKGKNADDIALVIDAMDLLHMGRFDGFVLVSSDSDFTRLASRIREQGLEVIGIGEKKTPEAFRKACNRFIYTESLSDEPVEQDGETLTIAHAARLMHRAFDAIAGEDDSVNLGHLGSEISRRHPDFDPRNYGHKKLSDLVKATRDFKLKGKTEVVKAGGKG